MLRSVELNGAVRFYRAAPRERIERGSSAKLAIYGLDEIVNPDSDERDGS